MATKIMTAYGNAQIDTAKKKFGTASGYFDGTGDYIDTPDSEDFNFSSGIFTIDFWVKRNNVGGAQYITGQSDSSLTVTTRSFMVFFGSINVVTFRTYSGSTSSAVTGTTAITADGLFHHIAGVGDGTYLKLYVDGTLDGTAEITGAINNSSYKLAIGRFGEFNNNYFNGWIDEFRISKGIARWTANFTPPTGPYTADAYTVLLLHMDGTDGSTSFIDDSASMPLGPNISVNVGGAWKAGTGYVNVGGIWKPVSSIHTKIDGTWKQA